MKFILILLLTISSTFAAVNGPCSGRDGVCIDSSTCSSYGGTTYSGKCPKDANNIKCCDSISCSANGKTGKCVFSSQCKGESVGGKCPGGSDFKCCLGSTSGEVEEEVEVEEVPRLINLLDHVVEEVEHVLMLTVFLVILQLFLVNAQAEVILNVVSQEVDLLGMLIKENIKNLSLP